MEKEYCVYLEPFVVTANSQQEAMNFAEMMISNGECPISIDKVIEQEL